MLYHHTVVIKEWGNITRDLLCRTTLSWRHIIRMRWKTHQCKQRKQSDCLMFTRMYCVVSQIHGRILISKHIVPIFPATVWSTFLHKSVVGRLYSDSESDWTVTWQLVNERQHSVMSCTKCSPHSEYCTHLFGEYIGIINFNFTLVICLRFFFYWNVRKTYYNLHT